MKRAYRARPGVMERELAQQAEYRARPEARERRLAANRRHKAANKERRREVDRAYRARPEVKARQRERQRLRRARRCKECGVDIRHLHGNARFCSKECWRKHYIARPEVRQRHACAALRRWQARQQAEREAQQQAEGAGVVRHACSLSRGSRGQHRERGTERRRLGVFWRLALFAAVGRCPVFGFLGVLGRFWADAAGWGLWVLGFGAVGGVRVSLFCGGEGAHPPSAVSIRL